MRLLSPGLAVFACFFWVVSVFPQAAAPIESDICVFGGTSAGVVAAVQAARSGQKVVLTEFGAHLGGMTSGGLSETDIGNKAAIGGISREFYKRMGRHYGSNEVWKLEPHVAEEVFDDMIREAGIPVYFHARLAKVSKTKRRITEITMEDGRVFRAKMFIDASYEGDLMAESGVSYFVGREANSTYHETLDGIRADTPKHQFLVPVDPYVQSGNPASGLLPWVQLAPKPFKEKYDYSIGSGPSINPHWVNVPGEGDKSIQAYNFRLCLTRNPTNRLPIEPPANYNPAQYELLGRYIEALVASGNKITLHNFMDIHPMPNGKTDVNNNGGFST
ncbi:MAG TPA: FAD-dependent oxidoreductase, partial [Verrucomicrobiae bacterium]